MGAARLARARGGEGTSGIPSWRSPPVHARDKSSRPVRSRSAAPGCPAAGEPARCPAACTPAPGIPGVARDLRGLPLRSVATRGARHRACPGTVERLRGDEPHRARCAWRGHRAGARCLPSDRLASAAARGSGTGEASGSLAFAWTVVTLGFPRAFTVASPGGTGDLAESSTLPSCASHTRRTRLAPCSSSSSSFRPGRGLLHDPAMPGLRRGRLEVSLKVPQSHPSGWPYDVSFEFPKIAPPLSREPRSPRLAITSP